jgi:flagellar export protein FliJ
MTMRGSGPFKYELEPLLTKQRWDVDALTLELGAAQAAEDEAERQVERVVQAVAELDARLAQARAEGAVIDLGHEQVLRAFRATQVEAYAAARADLDRAREQKDRIRQQLVDANARLRGFEAQKERQRKDHERAHLRISEREADEAWLLRRRVGA